MVGGLLQEGKIILRVRVDHGMQVKTELKRRRRASEKGSGERITFGFHVSKATVNDLNNAQEAYNALLQTAKDLDRRGSACRACAPVRKRHNVILLKSQIQ